VRETISNGRTNPKRNGESTRLDVMDAGLLIVTATMTISVKKIIQKSYGMNRKRLVREISVPDYANNI
jgi:hypothetical protein